MTECTGAGNGARREQLATCESRIIREKNIFGGDRELKKFPLVPKRISRIIRVTS